MTIPGGHHPSDGNSRNSSVFSSPESTLKSRTEFEYIPTTGWSGRDPTSPISPGSPTSESGAASSAPFKTYGRPYSPTYSTSATGFRLDGGDGNRSPGGTTVSAWFTEDTVVSFGMFVSCVVIR